MTGTGRRSALYATPVTPDQARTRIELRGAISSCLRCDALGAHCQAPVPFSGPTPAPASAPSRVLLLGDMPSVEDDRSGRLLSGPAGEFFAELLDNVGLDLSTMTVGSVVNCCTGGTKPSSAHIMHCLDHLRGLITLADPEWVVPLGAVPLSVVSLRAKITRSHGKAWQCRSGPFIDRWVFPMFHPFAGLKSPRVHAKLAGDVKLFADVLAGKVEVDSISFIG